MKVTFDSDDRAVKVTVPAGMPNVLASAGTSTYYSGVQKVAVSVLSTEGEVSLSIKPAVLAQQERQERLTQSIRLGFAPISRSTKV